MSNTELTIVDKIKNNDLVITDGSEYKIPMSAIFGKGILPKTESFGGRSLAENAQRVDTAIDNMKPLQNVWNHSHSQWDWKHITMSWLSDWRNMKQIEAEMSRKRGALNEAKWKQIKNEIKIRKMEEELASIEPYVMDDNSGDGYWKVIDLKVKIAELKEGIAEGTLYIEGAMKDVLALNEIFEQLKAKIANFTEEDFEREESKSHLKRSLVQCIRDVRQFGNITKGEQEYMEQIGVNPAKMLVLIKKYLEEEISSDDWSTTGLYQFVNQVVDDLIDNKKVDVTRMALFGFDHEPTKGINYDKPVAKLTNGE